MKHNIVFLVLVFLFFFISCTSWTPKEATQIDSLSSSGRTFSSLLWNIPPDISGDAGFLMCAQSNLDMCIQDTRSQRQQEIQCDEYLLESNQQNCRDSKVIESAMKVSDTTLCASLGEKKESCEFEVVSQNAIDTWNLELCNTLSEKFSLNCFNKTIYLQALSTKDIKKCDLIKAEEGDTLEKDMCKQDVLSTIDETNIEDLSVEK